MRFAELISILQVHVKLHESLYKLAERKTEALKKNDIDALSALMKDEQKHILAIRQLEERRIRWLKEVFPNESITTITRCLELAGEIEREELRQWHGRLKEAIARLKQANELNKQLLEQSLQFVTAMIDVMMPSAQPVAYNQANEYEAPPNRSIFESKA
jgi:flagellar biosynthesis/type III secretory pathway chaperone